MINFSLTISHVLDDVVLTLVLIHLMQNEKRIASLYLVFISIHENCTRRMSYILQPAIV